MKNPGWPHSSSPFHDGEQALQKKAGVQAKIDTQGRRIIRPYLTEQHRQFFSSLQYVLVGSLDSAGAPWASLLTGPPGFITTPNQHTLRVVAQPLPGDPLSAQAGKDIGLLGIELATRRRNRVNGKVTQRISHQSKPGFEIQVEQSFGNCPQYIQSRTIANTQPTPSAQPSVQPLTALSAADKQLIAAADTFFIATAYQNKSAGSASGVDVSHRGGQPGFVSIKGDSQLSIPDFSGNNHFNTLGNLLLNPLAGLLFIGFDSGDLLYLTGSAKVLWNSPTNSNGKDSSDRHTNHHTERVLTFQLKRGYRAKAALSLRWTPPSFSPFLTAHTA